jgi:hypothetical protein
MWSTGWVLHSTAQHNQRAQPCPNPYMHIITSSTIHMSRASKTHKVHLQNTVIVYHAFKIRFTVWAQELFSNSSYIED